MIATIWLSVAYIYTGLCLAELAQNDGRDREGFWNRFFLDLIIVILITYWVF